METKDINDKIKLIPLSPKKSLENIEYYSYYLDTALEEDTVRNVAITGNYGSGKSSLLETYFDNSKKNNMKLQVSLANFGNDDSNLHNKQKQCVEPKVKGLGGAPVKEKEPESETKNALRNVEKNIINQILYQIPPELIPLTSFRIKRELPGWKKFLISFEIVLLMSIVFPIDLFTSIDFTAFKYIVLAGFVFWNSLTLLSFIAIRKVNFKFHNLETEIQNQDEELFEKYADEIVYLLEKSGKRILVIEDLDRFECLDIFEKLRELNIKINNKLESRGERFIFIYAIKDDIFSDAKNRTKFFDLIIPVVPYLNAYNSYEKLKTAFKDENIDDELLYFIGFYIDDMRILNNIYNEFIVFKQNISFTQKDSCKLLAIIVYKNLHNKDFEELKSRRGEMYQVIKSAENYRDDIRDEMQQLKLELDKIDNERNSSLASSEEDLLMLWFKERDHRGYSFSHIKQFLANPNTIFNYREGRDSHTTTYSELKTTEEFKKNITYLQNHKTPREKEVLDRITILEVKINGELKDLVTEQGKSKENDFIYRAIEKGYIDENYEYYINYKYANNNDVDFVNNVFDNKKNIGFDLGLVDFTKIVNVLSDRDYEKEAILNYSLLDYYINNNKHEKVDSIIRTGIKSQSNFLEYYFNRNSALIMPYLLKSSTKLDLSKLDVIEDELIENKLFYENNDNYTAIFSKNWKDKLVNEDSISCILNGEDFSGEFKQYLIKHIKIKLDISEIGESYFNQLFELNLVKPTVTNVLIYFNACGQEINDHMLELIDEETLIMDAELPEVFYDKLLHKKGISNIKYELLFSKYNYGDYSEEHLSKDISKEKLQILVDLDLISISKEAIRLFEEKGVSYVSMKGEEIAKILLDNEDIMVRDFNTLLDIDTIDFDTRKQLFISRIKELSLKNVIEYLKKLGFSDDIVKIAKREGAFYNRKIDDTPYNRIILTYLVEEGVISNEQFNRFYPKTDSI